MANESAICQTGFGFSFLSVLLGSSGFSAVHSNQFVNPDEATAELSLHVSFLCFVFFPTCIPRLFVLVSQITEVCIMHSSRLSMFAARQ